MRTTPEVYKEIQRLFGEYQKEIEGLRAAGILQQNAVNTYLLHSKNFVRWVANDFEPGGRNKKGGRSI